MYTYADYARLNEERRDLLKGINARTRLWLMM